MQKRKVPELRFKEFAGEWEEKKLRTLSEIKIYNGAFNDPRKVGSGYKLINVVNLYTPRRIETDRLSLLELTKNEFKKYRAVEGDIFFTRSSLKPEGIAHCNILESNESKIVFECHIMRFRPCVKSVIPKYLVEYCNNHTARKFFMSRAKTGTMTTIDQKGIEDVPVTLPTLPEQQKMVLFLSKVDEKIEKTEKKKELWETYKKGLIQKIFSQQIRFKDNNSNHYPNWKEKRLGECIHEYKKKSSINNEYLVLTSSNKGLLLQSDYFGNNRIVDRENVGFNIIPENYITYRSRSDNRKFTFNVNLLGVTGIISTYYPVFKIHNGNNIFFITLFNYYKHYFGKYSLGTSQTVLSLNEIRKIKLSFPFLPEQQKIALFLSAIDQKIGLIAKELKALKEFKKGLLQKMFV